MAFSNTYDTVNTGSAVSNREHLTDVLTILAPEEIPLTSLAGKTKARATFVEWTVDDLASPVTTGIREGADVSSFTDKFANRARLGNYIQKFRRDYMVSDLQQAVDSVGPAKIAEAESKALREIRRDIEATLCSENDRAVEDGSGTAYALRGLGDWIDSAGPSDVPSAYRTPAGSIHSSGVISETVVNNILTSIYRQIGASQKMTLVADTALRNAIVTTMARAEGSTTAKVYTINEDASSKKVTHNVTVFEGPQGLISIVNMNPDCAPDTTNADTGYFVDPGRLEVAELIPVGSTMLENQGGGDRGYIDCALTLVVKHPQAFGKITAIA